MAARSRESAGVDSSTASRRRKLTDYRVTLAADDSDFRRQHGHVRVDIHGPEELQNLRKAGHLCWRRAVDALVERHFHLAWRFHHFNHNDAICGMIRHLRDELGGLRDVVQHE